MNIQGNDLLSVLDSPRTHPEMKNSARNLIKLLPLIALRDAPGRQQ